MDAAYEGAPWQREGFCEALVALLRNGDFQRFMQMRPYDYDGAGEPPCGLGPAVAEELVGFARRMRGTPFVGIPGKDSAFWVVSPAMYRDLFVLVSQANASSDLWRALERLGGRREVRELVARDLEAAVVRDGLAVDRAAVYGLVCEGRAPQTPAEHLVERTLELMGQEALRFASKADLEGLGQRLAAGFGDVASHPRYRMPVSEMLGDADWRPPTLGDLWDCIYNVEQREIHPLLGILFASDLVFDAEPFPRFNALMEAVVRRVLACQLGVPALAFVPLSALRLDWELGVQPQRYGRPYGRAVTPGPYGVDSTLMLRESIGFLKSGLAQVRAAVDGVQAEDARRCDLVEADWRLNPRQKELLCALVREPGRTVDALGYEGEFGVAMSTAHTDLAGLARLGFLQAQTVGRKQVYRLEGRAFGE